MVRKTAFEKLVMESEGTAARACGSQLEWYWAWWRGWFRSFDPVCSEDVYPPLVVEPLTEFMLEVTDGVGEDVGYHRRSDSSTG